MTEQPMCPECHQAISTEDTVSFDGSRLTRAHLYGCEVLPDSVRRRARAARQTARELVKRSHELRDTAEVMIRQTEAAIRALRDAMRLNPHSSHELGP